MEMNQILSASDTYIRKVEGHDVEVCVCISVCATDLIDVHESYRLMLATAENMMIAYREQKNVEN